MIKKYNPGGTMLELLHYYVAGVFVTNDYIAYLIPSPDEEMLAKIKRHDWYEIEEGSNKWTTKVLDTRT